MFDPFNRWYRSALCFDSEMETNVFSLILTFCDANQIHFHKCLYLRKSFCVIQNKLFRPPARANHRQDSCQRPCKTASKLLWGCWQEIHRYHCTKIVYGSTFLAGLKIAMGFAWMPCPSCTCHVMPLGPACHLESVRAEANLEPHFLHTKLRCTQHQSRLKPWHKLLVDCSVDFTVSFAYFVLAKHCSEKCPAFALLIDCLIRITRKKQYWKMLKV